MREGEPVLVWFARFADVDAHHRYESALLADGLWNTAVAQALLDGLQATAAAAAPGTHAAFGAAGMRRAALLSLTRVEPGATAGDHAACAAPTASSC